MPVAWRGASREGRSVPATDWHGKTKEEREEVSVRLGAGEEKEREGKKKNRDKT